MGLASPRRLKRFKKSAISLMQSLNPDQFTLKIVLSQKSKFGVDNFFFKGAAESEVYTQL
jgi:hypothetical protein